MITNKWIKGIDDLSLIFETRNKISTEKITTNDNISWHLLSYENDQITGTATITPYKQGWKISFLGVLSNHTNKKYADLLMRAIVLKVELMELRPFYAPIHSFFEHYGFETIDDEMFATKVKLPIYCKKAGGHN